MPLTGTLRSWNDERGFGFIAPTHGGAELFIHISAFPRDGSRPTVGEVLTYELGRGSNGQPQAVKACRTAIGQPNDTPRGAKTRRRSRGPLASILVVALLVAAGAYGYSKYQQKTARYAAEAHAWVRLACKGQLLGRLSHPFIARLLHAGSLPGGQPYLVLKHVAGERVDRWCDDRPSPLT